MRVCLHKGKLIEAQGNDNAPLETLAENAVRSGYNPEDIEVKLVSDEEFNALLAATAPPPETEDQRFERLRSENPLLDALINALEEKGTLTMAQVKGRMRPHG